MTDKPTQYLANITIDAQGYLCQLSDWSPSLAEEIAAVDGLVLSEAHWEILYFLRDFYQQHTHTPAMRALVKAVQQALGPDKGNSLYLYKLFPLGPAKQASKIAGLPKPRHCL